MKKLYSENTSLSHMRNTSFSKYVAVRLKDHGAMKIVPDNDYMKMLTETWSSYLHDNPLSDQTKIWTRNISRFGNGIYGLNDESSNSDVESLPQTPVVLTHHNARTKLLRKSLLEHTNKDDRSFSNGVFDTSYMQYLENDEAGYPAGWNLNKLPIPNAFKSFTVYEAENSFTPLTVQPFDLPKASLLLPTSYSKLWCIIDPKDQHKLNNYLNYHREWKCKSALLHCRSFMDLESLTELNVNFWTALQHPGELIVLGAGACYQSLTNGASVSEEVFFYEESLYTKCLQRSRCICLPVAKSHGKKIFAEIRGMSEMIEHMNYNVFNGKKKESQEYAKLEHQIANKEKSVELDDDIFIDDSEVPPEETNEADPSISSRSSQQNGEASGNNDFADEDAGVVNPTGQPLEVSTKKQAKGWTKRIPVLKSGAASKNAQTPEKIQLPNVDPETRQSKSPQVEDFLDSTAEEEANTTKRMSNREAFNFHNDVDDELLAEDETIVENGATTDNNNAPEADKEVQPKSQKKKKSQSSSKKASEEIQPKSQKKKKSQSSSTKKKSQVPAEQKKSAEASVSQVLSDPDDEDVETARQELPQNQEDDDEPISVSIVASPAKKSQPKTSKKPLNDASTATHSPPSVLPPTPPSARPPSNSSAASFRTLEKRHREQSRYDAMSPESKKAKREKMGNKPRNMTNLGSIFFQRQVDVVQQRLLRIMRDLEIYNEIENNKNGSIKRPRRKKEELIAQSQRDEAIKKDLIKDRDRYNILKQIYCTSKGTLYANLSVGIKYDEIIRLFFDNTSKINKKIWLLSVDNAIKDEEKRKFYKELIQDEDRWNEHFNINHGFRIPWRDWNELGKGEETPAATREILSTLEEPMEWEGGDFDDNDFGASQKTMESDEMETNKEEENECNKTIVESNDSISMDNTEHISDASLLIFTPTFFKDSKKGKKTFGAAKLTANYFETLLPGNMLSNFVVDEYFDIIMKRNIERKELKCVTTRTFIGYPEAAPVSYKIFSKSFPCDMFMAPILCDLHFILFVADFRKKKFNIYDSLMGDLAEHQRAIDNMKYIVEELAYQYMNKMSLSQWPTKNVSRIPQQTNHVDCGVFICEYARCLTFGLPIVNFSVSKARKRIASELVDGHLIEPTVADSPTQSSSVSRSTPTPTVSQATSTVSDRQ